MGGNHHFHPFRMGVFLLGFQAQVEDFGRSLNPAAFFEMGYLLYISVLIDIGSNFVNEKNAPMRWVFNNPPPGFYGNILSAISISSATPHASYSTSAWLPYRVRSCHRASQRFERQNIQKTCRFGTGHDGSKIYKTLLSYITLTYTGTCESLNS